MGNVTDVSGDMMTIHPRLQGEHTPRPTPFFEWFLCSQRIPDGPASMEGACPSFKQGTSIRHSKMTARKTSTSKTLATARPAHDSIGPTNVKAPESKGISGALLVSTLYFSQESSTGERSSDLFMQFTIALTVCSRSLPNSLRSPPNLALSIFAWFRGYSSWNWIHVFCWKKSPFALTTNRP